MRQAQAEMDKAVASWLESHRAYTKYLADTEVLFELFASAWRGSPRGLAEAFASYREALLAVNGYSHSEIRDFYPRRQPNAN
jgi:hypothetical protein